MQHPLFIKLKETNKIYDIEDAMVVDRPDDEIEELYSLQGINENQIADTSRRDIYIRAGMKTPRSIYMYRNFFADTEASNEDIYYLTMENGATIQMDTPSIMYVEASGENWQLKKDADGMVRLMHNNYQNRGGKQRTFSGSYHDQLGRDVTIREAIDEMCGYTYDKHLEAQEHKYSRKQTQRHNRKYY